MQDFKDSPHHGSRSLYEYACHGKTNGGQAEYKTETQKDCRADYHPRFTRSF
jgi:hypothetical protein